MKTAAVRSLVAIIIVISSALIASAQDQRLVVDVPFEFYVNDSRLPAGKYELFRSSELTNSTPLVVRSLKQDVVRTAVAMVNPEENSDHKGDSIIVFNRYGDKHFLSGVYSDKARVRLRLLRGGQERSLAGVGRPPTRVAVTQGKEKRSLN